MSKQLLSLLLGLSLLPAMGCNFGPTGNGSGDDDDSVGDDDDATGGDPTVVTIADIHAGDVADGTFITIEGSVVTTPMRFDEEDNEGDFWIAHPDGGPASGLFIYTFYDVVDALDEADDAQPGDVINITGTYVEAFDYGLPELRLTNASNVEVVGTTSLPTPHLVDADDISGGFADPELWGAVVAVEDITVGEAPSFENYNEWVGDGVIVVDDFYYADVEVGYTIDRLSGVLHPNFGDASVFPRWHDDVQFTYPGCDSSWTSDTVQGARCRVVDEDTEVTINNLVVTSPAPFFGDAFWVQDFDATGNFAGIQLFAIFDDLTIPAIGTELNFTGEVENFRGAAELILFSSDDLVETGNDRIADVVPLEITDPCTLGEEHEGMLVSIPTADVGALDYNTYPFEGCPLIGVSSIFWDDVSSWESDAGGEGTVTNLVGIVSERYEELSVNPRSTDDWDTWGAGSTSLW
ncbi:MAG: hypothetical protein KDA24_18130 [Deltaproteobacteria bacterium]|nr:hypothetical protein [Deltaproteobacteria bacterium]